MTKPPYQLSQEILDLCFEIGRLLGQYEGLKMPKPQPELRRTNRLRSIQSSLSIEGNRLSLGQVSALFENKKVVGPKKDILEVQNAIRVYDQVTEFNVLSERSFCKAHGGLMEGLIPEAGWWRTSGIGILKDGRVVHVAPNARMVPRLMTDLFDFLRSGKRSNYLILSSVFHYEVEFIHPFSDGNGRMGRLWQYALLIRYHPFFEFVPIESVIKKHQEKYYESLALSDKKGESTPFITFCLRSILESAREFLDELKPEPMTPDVRLESAKRQFGTQPFSRKDYLIFFKTLSTATASRDLSYGVGEKILKRSGEKALCTYKFITA